MSGDPGFWSSLAEHWHIAGRLRGLTIHYDPEQCSGAWSCYDVCPVDCWTPDYQNIVAVFHHPERCIACSACVLQCPEQAIELK